MNYFGSYRKLLKNSKAAMMAAIEIYNKPTFRYRDECTVILILNAWELILKALLSKNKKSIFYPKQRNQPYRTFSRKDALTKAMNNFPKEVKPLPIKLNLKLLSTYRDETVHFYNTKGFGIVYYDLAQTCIKNFRDLLEKSFEIHLEDEINWQLLPLGIKPPVDIATYMSGQSGGKQPPAVQHFLTELTLAYKKLKEAGEDTERLAATFSVKLESVKKIGDADVIIGIKNGGSAGEPSVVTERQDSNTTHPLREKDILAKIKKLHSKNFTPYICQAIVWKYQLKNIKQYCWTVTGVNLTRYSQDVITFIKQLSSAELTTALNDYKKYRYTRRKEKKD